MDFTLSTKEHRAAVDAAADALPRRTGILPALTLVRIDARADGRITFQGTDLEFAIEAEVRGEVRTPGSLCLPGNQLADIARESDPGGQTRIHADGTTGLIETGRSRFRLAAAPAADYVGGPDPAGEAPVTVSGDVLRAMAGRVAWVASKEESRGSLCGVLLETTATSLRMVATNGKQLALSEAPLAGLTPGIRRVVPPQLLATAERLLKGRGPVEVSLGESTVGLRVAGLALSARTLAGSYVDYGKVLPKQPTTYVQLPTASFLQAVRRMATVARAHDYKAIIARAEGRALRLWTRTPDVGTAHDVVEAAILESPATVAFNAGMMEDVLASVAAEEVRVRIHGSKGGILIDGRGDDPVRSLWLVMPVSLDSLDCTEPEEAREPAAEPLAAAA
jgi:DNA polymerase III subunit beta